MALAYNFIFSNGIFFRLSRHLAFWLAFAIWVEIDNDYHLRNLPACVLTTYTTIYFLLPRYLLRNKYRQFIVASLLCGILYPLIFIFNPVRYSLGSAESILDYAKVLDGVFNRQDIIVWRILLWDAWGLTMCWGGFAAVLKLMKLYYLENTENKRLQEKKINHELQELKSQLNSRFLFDALQSIQQHVRNQSFYSSELILKLSDLLSYILYENDKKCVPLQKEIEMIEGYLKFENESHGSIIDINVIQQGKIGDKNIVPLMLLPLVESCFDYALEPKKGAGLFLDFDISNLLVQVTLKAYNLQSSSNKNFQQSIRHKNIKKRLDFYYPGRHDLQISEDKGSYFVRLELAL